MVTTEQLIRHVKEGLRAGPMQNGIVSLQAAPLKGDSSKGVTFLLRTAPEFSGRIAALRTGQYRMSMVSALMASFFGVIPHYLKNEVMITYSELLLLTIVQIDNMGKYGFSLDPDLGILYAPTTPTETLQTAMQLHSSQFAPVVRRLGKWGTLLATAKWLRPTTAPSKLGVQYAFLPDLPADDLALSHFEHAVRVSYGWNLTALYTNAQLREEAEDLRRALREAKTIRTF